MSLRSPHNQTRFKYRSRTVRPAFSLAELIVSIGILLLMLSLAGQVYTFTVKSTGQATALSEINQQLRIFEQTLREDLAAVDPAGSVMVIQGNPVNAFWTSDQREADGDGSPANDRPRSPDPMRADDKGILIKPRADLLMFFTNGREQRSYTDPKVKSDLQQVVYGHAELGEYELNEGASRPCERYEFRPGAQAFPQDSRGYPDPSAVSPVPAQAWHLARRSVLMLPGAPPRRACDIIVNYLDEEPLLQGATDFIGAAPPPGVADFTPPDCGYLTFEQSVLSPAAPVVNCPAVAPWYLPPIFGDQTKDYVDWLKPYARSQLDQTPPALFADRLSSYMLPNCASFKVEWTLDPRGSFVDGRLDGLREVLWFDPGASVAPDKGDPLASLVAARDAACGDPARKSDCTKLTGLLGEQTVQSDGRRYSLCDRLRAAGMKCDPASVFSGTLAPDGRANLVAFGPRPRCVSEPPRNDTSCPSRYRDVGSGYCLSPAMEDPTCTNSGFRDDADVVSDDMFPRALRITVDVYDSEGRLERPIRHVMVVPVGN